MDSNLRIGEVARLLGVTPKTIRHYEKVGLVEPRRSDNEYRLYSAEEVLRLRRIKQLQSLGLSLKQIGAILNDHDNEQLWAAVLETLLDDIDSEIERLEARKARVRDLLTHGIPHWLEAEPEPLTALIGARMSLAGAARTDRWALLDQMESALTPGAVGELLALLLRDADLYRRSQLVAALTGLSGRHPASPAKPPLEWQRGWRGPFPRNR